MIYELPKTDDESVVIKNRHNKNLFVIVKSEHKTTPTKLAFLAHGFNDVHDSAHMRAMTAPLLRAGYRVVLWDATNSRGRSDGTPRQVSLTTYLHDCQDVVAWAKRQEWFFAQYILGGHSMGGATAGLFAASVPDEVERMILLAPLVSGWRTSMRVSPLFRLMWRQMNKRNSSNKQHRWLSFGLLKDLRRYDLMSVSHRLGMPTLILVGEKDFLTPVVDQRLLVEILPKGKLVVVKGSNHNFSKPIFREHLAQSIVEWMDE